MNEFTTLLWITRTAATIGGLALVLGAGRGLRDLLQAPTSARRRPRAALRRIGLVGLQGIGASLCGAVLLTEPVAGDSWFVWLIRSVAAASSVAITVALFVAFVALIGRSQNVSTLDMTPRPRWRSTRSSGFANETGSLINPATGLPMVGLLDAAGNAYGTGDDSFAEHWPSDHGHASDTGTTASDEWYSHDDHPLLSNEPSFGSDESFSSDSSFSDHSSGLDDHSFDHDLGSSDSPAYSDHDSSHDDWSNAWGTAADFQIPAESDYDFPSHDYTTSTYGDDSSWSHD
jgi:hypothetical protein